MVKFLTLTTLLVLADLAVAADPKAPAKITYDDHVLPVLRDKCISCHGQDKKSGGVQLHTFAKVMEGGGGGALVKPGDASASPLFLVVSHKQEPFMPPRSPLLSKEAELLEKWIKGGALENNGSKPTIIARNPDIGLKAAARGKPDGPPPMPPANLPLDPVVRAPRANAITALASSPWAPLLAVAGQKQVLLYHADTLDLIGVLPFPEGQVNVLKFSRNAGLLLAAGGRGGKAGRVVVWQVTTGKRIVEVGDETDAVLAADISPDQTQIALGGPSKVVRIYTTRDSKLQHEIRKHTDWVTSLEFSPDGVLLATGDRNGGLFVWEAFTAREYFSLRGHTAAITDVSWRPDGNVCASSSEDGSVRLWEMENGNQIKSWTAHGGGTQAVRYGHDGRLVSAGRDRLVKIWDGNGTVQKQFEALPDVALRATFSHDGTKVVAGDWTGKLPVWTSADGKSVGELSANPAPVAERLDAALKDLAARQTTRDQSAATAAAAKVATIKVQADLATAQKAVADGPGLVKAAQDNAVRLKAAADQARTAAAAAQSDVRARTVLHQALAEAAGKVKAAADGAAGDAPLAAAAAKAAMLAQQAQADLTQSQKTAADQATNLRNSEAAAVAAQQNVVAVTNTMQAAPKQVEALTAQVKAAVAKQATDEAAAAQAATACALAAQRVERLEAAQTVARQPAP